MFDFHVLDMIELGIEKFASLKEIKVTLQPTLVASELIKAWMLPISDTHSLLITHFY